MKHKYDMSKQNTFKIVIKEKFVAINKEQIKIRESNPQLKKHLTKPNTDLLLKSQKIRNGKALFQHDKEYLQKYYSYIILKGKI